MILYEPDGEVMIGCVDKGKRRVHGRCQPFFYKVPRFGITGSLKVLQGDSVVKLRRPQRTLFHTPSFTAKRVRLQHSYDCLGELAHADFKSAEVLEEDYSCYRRPYCNRWGIVCWPRISLWVPETRVLPQNTQTDKSETFQFVTDRSILL